MQMTGKKWLNISLFSPSFSSNLVHGTIVSSLCSWTFKEKYEISLYSSTEFCVRFDDLNFQSPRELG